MKTFSDCISTINRLHILEEEKIGKKIDYCVCIDNNDNDPFFISITSVAERFYPERIMCQNINIDKETCIAAKLFATI